MSFNTITEAFLNASRKKFEHCVAAHFTHRSAAGTFLAGLGVKKGSGYYRVNSPFAKWGEDAKDNYYFHRSCDAIAFQLWIPSERRKIVIHLLKTVNTPQWSTIGNFQVMKSRPCGEIEWK